MKYLFLVLTIISCFGCGSQSVVQTISNNNVYEVHNSFEFKQVLKQLQRGDKIRLHDGVYTNVNVEIVANGSANSPIQISAVNPGEVQITGDYHWEIKGDYIHTSGLYFTNGTRKIANDLIVDTGNYNQYTNCKFNNLNDVAGVFIKLEGKYTTVENCEFTGKTTLASYINMDVPKTGGSYHTIKKNYFSRPPLGKNGGSAMRVGHGSMALFNGHILIEENLFENCDGESEIVSVKSSKNHIRNNTFKNCKGAFSLRQGRGSVFENNIFIGDGKKKCGGLAIRGQDHIIINNYFYQLNSKRTGGISFGVASEVDSARIKLGLYPRHFPLTKNIMVAHNTFIENKSPFHLDLLLGYGTRNRFVLPENIRFFNNVFHGRASLITQKDLGALTFKGNIAQVNTMGINGVELTDFGTIHIINAKEVPYADPAYQMYEGLELLLKKDIFGKIRTTETVVGCASKTILRGQVPKPLTKENVGCSF